MCKVKGHDRLVIPFRTGLCNKFISLAHQVKDLLLEREDIPTCRIPDDCIDEKRYPLFMARAVLQELIKSLQSTRGAKPC